MIRIRQAQVDILERRPQERRDADLAAAMRQAHPWLTGRLSDASLAKAVRLGRERAAAYSLAGFAPVRDYVDCIFRYGIGFATDPVLPWAAAVLNNPLFDNELNRAAALQSEAQRYDEAVAGLDGARTRDALHRLLTLQEDVSQVPSDKLAAAILRLCGEIYPEKTAYAGLDVLRGVLMAGQHLAYELGIETHRGYGAACGLLLGLGHQAADDPCLPWVRESLAGHDSDEARVEALENAARAEIEAFLENA